MSSVLSYLFGGDVRANAALDDRMYDKGSGAESSSGTRVSPETAMKVSAVYRCVSIRANAMAMFPLGIYEFADGADEEEATRRRAREHPMDAKLSFAPNKRQTSFEMRRQLWVSYLLRQNAYAQIVPDAEKPDGQTFNLIPLHPDRVDGPEETAGGELRYTFKRNNGEKVPLLGDIDIVHLKGLSEDGLKGLSLMDNAKDSIGLAQAAEQHAAAFYKRGMKISGVLEHPNRLNPKTAEAMGDSFRRKWGGALGVGGVPVLWEGMKFNSVSMSHKDAEFLETRKFSVTDIARWFGVPPHMVMDVERSTSWGTGIESQGLQFLIYTLLPDIVLFEQTIQRVLIRDPQRYYPKHNVNAILRADSKTQAEVFKTLIEVGVYSPDEVRSMLDRNPRADGKGGEYASPGKAAAPAPGPGQPTPAPDEDEPEAEKDDKTKAAIALAERLAAPLDATTRWCAAQLVDRELGELRALAQRHAAVPNGVKHRNAVASFYGRFAAVIGEAMGLTPERAKEVTRELHGDTIAASGQPEDSEAWRTARVGRVLLLTRGRE